MDDNYVEFSSKLTRDVHLVKKTEQLLEEIGILQNRINDQVCFINTYRAECHDKTYLILLHLLYRSK